MTEDEIADALRWVARLERLHFGGASLIGGFSFREKDYRRPKHFQTIRDALALAQKVRDGSLTQLAALQKLAPEIGKLVEAGRHIGETAHNLTIREDYDVPPHKALALFGTDGDLLAIFEGDYMGSDMDDAEFFIAAANSRPILKAIYDNLTAFGKDTSHD